MQENILGVDIGGTGIKGAIVSIPTGELLTERHRLSTPQPPTPEAVAKVFAELVSHFDYDGPIGVGFPAIIKNGAAMSASNIDRNWIGKHVAELLGTSCGHPAYVLNDADAAGIAEMQFGEGQGRKGLTMMITIGSGLGSSLFLDGKLLPNTEFGHVVMHGDIAERYASNRTRKDKDLSWTEWGKRFNEYLQHIYMLLSPDTIILSGGASKKFAKYENLIDLPIPVVPARLLNNAGTVGAALYAAQRGE